MFNLLKINLFFFFKNIIFNFYVNFKSLFLIFLNSFFLFKLGKKNLYYKHFDYQRAYINFWYESRIFNIEKYNRFGLTDYLGSKNNSNSKYWFYNLPVIKFYNNYGCISLLLGCIIWILTSLCWLAPDYSLNKIILIFSAILSTELLRQFFKFQNYNCFGWMLVPITFYFFFYDYFYTFLVVYFFLSYFSISVYFVTFFPLLFLILNEELYNYLIPIFLPSLIYVVNIISSSKNFKIILSSIKSVLMSIGFFKDKVSRRFAPRVTKKIEKREIFTFFLYVQFIIVFILVNSNLPIIFLISLALHYFNRLIRRFADDQNTEFLIFNLMFLEILSKNNIFLIEILSFWIANSYYFFIPNKFPLNLKKTFYLFKKFLKPVPNKSVVLANYKKPKKYDDIFDNQREMSDILINIATKNKILIFPDYNTVFSDNFFYKSFWGLKLNKLNEHQKKLKIDYFLHTNLTDKVKKKINKIKTYKLVNEFDWQKMYLEKKIIIPNLHFFYKKKLPKWGLIKIKKRKT